MEVVDSHRHCYEGISDATLGKSYGKSKPKSQLVLLLYVFLALLN